MSPEESALLAEADESLNPADYMPGAVVSHEEAAGQLEYAAEFASRVRDILGAAVDDSQGDAW